MSKKAFPILLFFVAAFVHCFHAGAQSNERIDSLLYALKNSGEDTNTVKTLDQLAYEYLSTDTALSRKYAANVFLLSHKLGFNKGIAAAYMDFGRIDRAALQSDAAIKNYNQAVVFYGKANSSSGIVHATYDIAGVYKKEGKYDDAFTAFTKCRELAEKISDDRYLARSLAGYADIYRYRGDYVTSLSYYQQAVTAAEKTGDKSLLGGILTNMAIIYGYRKNYDEEFKIRQQILSIYTDLHDSSQMVLSHLNLGGLYYDKGDTVNALNMFNTALDIVHKIGDERAGYKYVADCYGNLGMIALDQGKYETALVDYTKNLNYMIKGGEKKGTANAYGDLANVYIEMKKWDVAEKFVENKLSIATQIGYKSGRMRSYAMLAEIRYGKGDFKAAYDFLERYNEVHDSIMNDESSQQLADMQTKYKTQQQDQELKMQNAKMQIQNAELARSNDKIRQRTFLLYGAGGVLTVFIAMGFFLYTQVRQKKKANLRLAHQNQSIRLQSDQITHQKEIIEAKNKDITDSIRYAKRIQEAILPHDDLIYEILKECFVLYMPKDIVSGDFYWVNRESDNVLFSVIDCTGHGVPGALMSVVAHSAINSVFTRRPNLPPAGMLNFLHDAVKETFRQRYTDLHINDGMDMALCALDRKNMKLRYAGARVPVCIVRDAELIEIRGDKQSISSREEEICQPFTAHEIDLKKGDNIYIFSDGYADQFGGPKGKKFKYANLKKMLREIAALPVHRQKTELQSNIENWRGQHEQVDDILVLGVRV